MPQRFTLLALLSVVLPAGNGLGETPLRRAATLEEQLKQHDPATLAQVVRQRGDERRGAVIFYTSPAACVNCHLGKNGRPPLGPELAKLGELNDVDVIDSLLHPAKKIRKGYETVSVLTADGQVFAGMIAEQNDDAITLRMTSDLDVDTRIARGDIETIRASDQSMMPEGLIGSIREQRDFIDLAKYVMEVAAGGPARFAELNPPVEAIQFRDDTIALDHAGILQKLRERDFVAGGEIFHGYCADCHGKDGSTPSLPTARAFGSQRLKFGADPYRMFLTLSHGNGLMAPMRHLTPHERYQVVHYVREQFMKPSSPDYAAVDKTYLASLPKGNRDGTEVREVLRDYGPALASQLRRQYSSVLTIKLDQVSIAYDLHTMDQAGIWTDGFLDLSDTQHARDRGEGTASPAGKEIAPLSYWKWGHEGTFDYSTDGLAPRGPLPTKWMDYHGHYRWGNEIVFSYKIDGREVLESPQARDGLILHRLEVGPGPELTLAVASGNPAEASRVQLLGLHDGTSGTGWGAASQYVIAATRPKGDGTTEFVTASVFGDATGLRWSSDTAGRLVLTIPASDHGRAFTIARTVAEGDQAQTQFIAATRLSQSETESVSLRNLTQGGPLLWPEVMETVGVPGLEQDGYALDTLTLPDQTPWNTWFRTSALDFFPDGRMVLATYGGDIWIVSGINAELDHLRWKRFAAGLYEPFGVKVVDEQVYVTCKDRLTRLHDLNGDDEADFYESFSADQDVSVNFHAFNFDLQTDQDGSFYYAKSGHGGDSEIPGAVIKVSKDGRTRELFCTGFRTPNGMGMLPNGRPVASDNQGQWMPASKINLLRPDGFYGWVQTYSTPGKWAPGGGSIDLEKVVPPDSFDQPLIWMPQDFDNSSGGQLWVDDPRFGPLSDHLLHTSFGKGWMSYVMMQEIDDVTQGAIIKLPFDFRTGVMRARVNPADGQVYATGLQGWNGGGRIGLLDGGVQRLRFTGKSRLMVTDAQVESDGLRITFNAPLDPNASTDPNGYSVEHWNYHWRAEYGSDMHSPTTDEVGIESLSIESISMGSDGRSVKLRIPDLIPVDQLHLILRVRGEDGQPLQEEIYWTIHRIPSAF